ncbi:hypothetical protein [Caballeronia sp. Lep1P3]|uniref:hypothetical protein n=1 Tax=Caballeronia sp. Lep1P3 TaxID=2878150 RepID=UPI001FD4C38E|nr:hypothetical protein [Caballeronia sp. Lep1P3]
MTELSQKDQATIAMFRTYLTENPDLAGALVEVGVTEGGLRYNFVGVRNEVFLVVRSNGIMVPVELEGELYDFLIDLECAPRPLEGGGYFCNFSNVPDETFATLDELFRAHSFSSLREWVQERLLPARYLVLYGDPATGESSCAWLAKTLDEVRPEGRAFQLREDIRSPLGRYGEGNE